jgi:hypothetical protein
MNGIGYTPYKIGSYFCKMFHRIAFSGSVVSIHWMGQGRWVLMIRFDKSLRDGPPSIQVTRVELIFISYLFMWSKHTDLAERMQVDFSEIMLPVYQTAQFFNTCICKSRLINWNGLKSIISFHMGICSSTNLMNCYFCIIKSTCCGSLHTE